MARLIDDSGVTRFEGAVEGSLSGPLGSPNTATAGGASVDAGPVTSPGFGGAVALTGGFGLTAGGSVLLAGGFGFAGASGGDAYLRGGDGDGGAGLAANVIAHGGGPGGDGTLELNGPGGVLVELPLVDPGNPSLGGGAVAIWLDPTPGAARIRFKARDSNGALVSGAIPLA